MKILIYKNKVTPSDKMGKTEIQIKLNKLNFSAYYHNCLPFFHSRLQSVFNIGA